MAASIEIGERSSATHRKKQYFCIFYSLSIHKNQQEVRQSPTSCMVYVLNPVKLDEFPVAAKKDERNVELEVRVRKDLNSK
jgi:hypothetical protein